MATEDGLPDNPSRDRATVALVAEKVESLREITKAGFSDTQRQLDQLSGIPVAVTEVRSDLAALARRVTDLEAGEDRGREWKRGQLPAIVVAAISALVSIGLLIATFH